MEGLGINLPSLIAQLINFTILFGLLYVVAYKPLMRMLDERSRRVKESMEQTEFIKQQAVRAEQETEKLIAEASKEGKKIIDQAVKIGEEMKQKAQGEARQEAETLINKAQAEIQRERAEAVSELRGEFADLTIRAAGKVIGRSLDKEAHRQLIDQALKESAGLKKG